jgi:uncharacterized protein (DUF1919 family)
MSSMFHRGAWPPLRTEEILLQARLREALHGRAISIVSSNCIGARLSQLAGEPYRSPTVGLWFRPDDFLRFATDLAAYTKVKLAHDVIESARMGYPVGTLADVKIMFMHYASFAEAQDSWVARAQRIDRQKLLLVFTDRDGATADHLSRFDALAYPKLLFVSKPWPQLKSALWVRHGNEPHQVGDLTTYWHHLAPVLSQSVLQDLAVQFD